MKTKIINFCCLFCLYVITSSFFSSYKPASSLTVNRSLNRTNGDLVSIPNCNMAFGISNGTSASVLAVRAVNAASPSTIVNFTFSAGVWTAPVTSGYYFFQIQINGHFGSLNCDLLYAPGDCWAFPNSSGTAWYDLTDFSWPMSCTAKKIHIFNSVNCL